MLSVLPLLTVGAVGLHIRHHDGSLTDAVDVAHQIAASIERHAGISVVIDDPSWARCQKEEACEKVVARRLHVEEVLFVSVYASRTLVRIIVQKGNVEVRRDTPSSGLARVIEEIVGKLFDNRLVAPRTTTSTPSDEAEWRTTGLVTAGAGLALIGVGTALLALNRSAEQAVEARIHGRADYDRLAGEHRAYGWGAAGAFALGVGALGVGAYLTLW